MIPRPRELRQLSELIEQFPVVAIVGARQVGKTTLAKSWARRSGLPCAFFDLEKPEATQRLADPTLALEPLRGLVVIDEVQHRPDLFPLLRVLADRRPRRARFLLLGSASPDIVRSASPDIVRSASESLAGRIAYYELKGLGIDEVGAARLDHLWFRGGFPLSFLAGTNEKSGRWRDNFIQTFVRRDLPDLGFRTPSSTMLRFWHMLAHYHGQTWNSSEFARAFGVSDSTVRHYLDQLSSALVVRQLPPWHESLAKRQVKSPKVYISDSGILHTLLGLKDMHDLQAHPKIGASWEGFMIEQVARLLNAEAEQCYFWATHNGAELDLLVVHGRKRLGFEIKRTTAPAVTPSMRIALKDLKLTSLDVIHAGKHTFPLTREIRAVAAERMLDDISPLRG